MPNFCRYAAVLWPIPQTLPALVFARYVRASRSGMAVRPSGFFHLEPSLARTLVAESPSENVMPSSRCRSALIAAAYFIHALREERVRLVIRRKYNGVGAELPRFRKYHAALHAAGLHVVRHRRDDAALTPRDDGLTAQLGVARYFA